MTHELPKLGYAYNALDPHIDAQTMEIHHSKHHQAYVNKLNEALADLPEWQDRPVLDLLQNIDSLPEKQRAAIRNNGGGHYNHSFFWNCMAAPASGGGKLAEGDLARAIGEAFEGLAPFQEKFSQAAMGRFGSGWAWLAAGRDNSLSIISTANQDSPVSEGLRPILALDVWEHAYYLKYQNRRPEYVSAWWNVVNWEFAAKMYSENNPFRI